MPVLPQLLGFAEGDPPRTKLFNGSHGCQEHADDRVSGASPNHERGGIDWSMPATLRHTGDASLKSTLHEPPRPRGPFLIGEPTGRLPHHRHAVGGERRVLRDDRTAVEFCLCDQQAVEGVAVVKRQGRDGVSVPAGDRQ